MRFMKVLGILVIGVLGCPLAKAQEDRHWHTKAIFACEDKMNSGHFKRRLDFAHCVNAANARAWKEDRTPHLDLLNHAMAQELVAAEAFDRGRLTEIQYAAARAKIKTELAGSFDARDRRDNPVVIQQPRRSFSCYTFGAVTNCY